MFDHRRTVPGAVLVDLDNTLVARSVLRGLLWLRATLVSTPQEGA
ncbi:hypothetical protein [Oerskovia paurometabola]|uniref:Hydrolase n=1 Tax=Oerskovia paurometabola TaxID=162170 RepID=A0ABW1XD74_9CELL|nr:hypothetical protein [Oerskovia paurometabola]MBM7496232.1 putative HAD superfamily phosphohydrolase YqeG [Oerskovia paurometabola]